MNKISKKEWAIIAALTGGAALCSYLAWLSVSAFMATTEGETENQLAYVSFAQLFVLGGILCVAFLTAGTLTLVRTRITSRSKRASS